MVVNLYMVSLDNRAGKPEREAVARVDSPPGDVAVRARPEGDVASKSRVLISKYQFGYRK